VGAEAVIARRVSGLVRGRQRATEMAAGHPASPRIADHIGDRTRCGGPVPGLSQANGTPPARKSGRCG